MTMNNSIYDEILKKEKKWSNLISLGLLNVYSLKCKNGIQEFYLDCSEKIRNQNIQINNLSTSKVLELINAIIIKINHIIVNYESGKNVDITELLDLFLINQINKKNEDVSSNLESYIDDFDEEINNN